VLRATATIKTPSDIAQLLMIHDKMGRKPSELSGGEQQRVAIARAVVNRPSILLADEPTGNLDSRNSEIVLNMFRELNRKLRQTIVLVTHNPDLIAYADRLIEMRDGVIVNALGRVQIGQMNDPSRTGKKNHL
jgi:putative ABC transport system ATP-binding protein